MKKIFIFIFIFILFKLISLNPNDNYYKLSNDWAKKYLESVLNKKIDSFQKKDGLISSENLALSIVLPILYDIYGKNNIEKQKPYQIFLIGDYWIISGSLKKGYRGGTFMIILSRIDGRIIHLIHGK